MTAIYLIWFVFLYLCPAFIFHRRLYIAPELIMLEGVSFTPHYGNNHDIIAINNNFDRYMGENAGLSETIAAKTLRIMCDDAQAGNKKRPEYYLLKYKNAINKFSGYIFLGSFVPLIVLAAGMPASQLLLPQIICVFLIVLLHGFFIHYRYETFCNIFYRKWYDKILNFDLIAVNYIKPYILDAPDNGLSQAVQSLIEHDNALAGALVESSNKLADQLTAFAGQDSITPESVAKLLDDNLKNVAALNTDMKEVCDKTEGTMKSLIGITEAKNSSIDAINKNTTALIELKKLFASHKDKELTAELAQLQKISGCLDHTINGSFNSIEQAARDNTKKLTETYDSFFEICGRFTGMIEKDYDTKTAASLQSVNDSMVRIEAMLKSLDDSARQLNETLGPEKSSAPSAEMQKLQYGNFEVYLGQDIRK